MSKLLTIWFRKSLSRFQLEPSWDIGSAPYVMWAVQEALARDVNKMRPMTHPVFNTSQIEATFDYVIYLKGECEIWIAL